MDRGKIRAYCLITFATVLFYLAVVNIPVIGGTIVWVFHLFSPFIFGIILAFIFDGITNFLNRKVISKIFSKTKPEKRRAISGICTIFLSIGVISLLFTFILPEIIESIQKLASNIQTYLSSFRVLLSDLQERWDIPDFVTEKLDSMIREGSESLLNYITQSIPSMLNFAISMGNSLMNFLIALTVSIHLLFSKHKMLKNYHRVINAFAKKTHIEALQDLSDTALPVFRKYINGQLLDATLIGVISFIFLYFGGFPYAILISLLMGISNIIPFFGPFIGATPSFLLILMINPVQALWYLIFVIVLQQFDGNFMAPKIIGDSVGLPPIWVLFSVTIGGALFGISGMIFGTPVMATLYAIVRRAVIHREEKRDALSSSLSEDNNIE